MKPPAETLTIGQVARAAGVSVRVLRHYDRVGLVPAATRTVSGHRRYWPDVVSRVRHVLALRLVGLSLAEIGEVIDGDEALLAALIRARRRELDTRLADLELTRRQLRGAERDAGDSILTALEEIMTGSTFTAEQLRQLKARHSSTALADWTARSRELDAAVRALQESDTAPTSDSAQAAVRQWHAILSEMSAGDPDIAAAIVAKLDRRGAAAATAGVISEQTWSYLRRVPTG
ncbi:MerR family DNA-binding transcriptional regulator [Pseudofrankia sp. BMG5.36]|uniref:MerR family DNA-binding transcriptional regulator n=1 Tax=Pseudofrankia sp. BMG5.36 TaxID=1834512 RepID=UPI0008DAA6FD|nr:MerR family DNA-binding transcriptional regulator [Pseudofrankia sp. BMG5.36]OHV48961.1 hypothetical protein BCD48_14055 [Pseudofrankia sp. BMG5.36]